MNPTKITVYKEYDKDGKITKKTVIKEYAQITLPVPSLPKITPNSPWNPSQPYWQQPLISYGSGAVSVPHDTTIVVNGELSPGQINEAILAEVKSHN